MADDTRVPEPRRVLLAVYPTQSAADEARRAAVRAGAAESAVRVGSESDLRASLRAEMRDEVEQSWISPQAAVAYPKESAKGVAAIMPVASLLGALIALPFGFIEFFGMSLWARLLLVVIAGAVAGATVALAIGPALGQRGRDERLGAEKGVTVRVDDGSDAVVDALKRFDPIRLDVLAADDTPVGTITTEEQRSDEGMLQDIASDPESDASRTGRN